MILGALPLPYIMQGIWNEYCFLDRFHTLLLTGGNQFGFKKGIGCTHAIYSYRNIVDHFGNSGGTVNICALDLFLLKHSIRWTSRSIYQTHEKAYSSKTVDH